MKKTAQNSSKISSSKKPQEKTSQDYVKSLMSASPTTSKRSLFLENFTKRKKKQKNLTKQIKSDNQRPQHPKLNNPDLIMPWPQKRNSSNFNKKKLLTKIKKNKNPAKKFPLEKSQKNTTQSTFQKSKSHQRHSRSTRKSTNNKAYKIRPIRIESEIYKSYEPQSTHNASNVSQREKKMFDSFYEKSYRHKFSQKKNLKFSKNFRSLFSSVPVNNMLKHPFLPYIEELPTDKSVFLNSNFSHNYSKIDQEKFFKTKAEYLQFSLRPTKSKSYHVTKVNDLNSKIDFNNANLSTQYSAQTSKSGQNTKWQNRTKIQTKINSSKNKKNRLMKELRKITENSEIDETEIFQNHKLLRAKQIHNIKNKKLPVYVMDHKSFKKNSKNPFFLGRLKRLQYQYNEEAKRKRIAGKTNSLNGQDCLYMRRIFFNENSKEKSKIPLNRKRRKNLHKSLI